MRSDNQSAVAVAALLQLVFTDDDSDAKNRSHKMAASTSLHEFSIYEKALWYFLYALVTVLSVTGNMFVVIVVLTRPRMQTVTNYFILNLAVADTLTGMLSIPFKFQAALLQYWALPAFMCGLVPFIETVTLSVSVFTLTATAIDRFRAVVLPLTQKLHKNGARLIIFAIWCVSLASSLPYGIYHQVRPPPWDANATFVICMPIKWMLTWWKIYNVYLVTVQYFIPVIIINVTYLAIVYKLWIVQPIYITAALQDCESFEKSKKKVIKMLVMVVTVFTFCWLPLETYLILSELRPNVNEFQYINVIFFCCHWLAMSNSCLNPIIYGIYNEKFRREYSAVIWRFCGKQLPNDLSIGQLSPALDEFTKRSQLGGANDDTAHSSLNDVSKRNHLPAHYAAVCHNYIASELGHDEQPRKN